MPERIECVYYRCLLVGDHPNFLEIEATAVRYSTA
jgi:hypothetical protein